MAARHRLDKATTLQALAFLAGFSVFGLHSTAYAFQSDKDLFQDLNMAARTAYAKARDKVLEGNVPVFVVSDKVTLVRGQHLGSRAYTPILYDQLKSLSHLPLGIAGAGLLALEKSGDSSWRTLLQDIRAKARVAQERMSAAAFNENQKARQTDLINRSIAYIDRALASPTLNPDDLKAYASSVGPLVLANANDAAQAQIDMLDQAVKELAQQLTADEWARATAVITGPKTAREGNLQSQYFLFAWNEKATGNRVLYMENIFEDDPALAVLQTVLNDRKIGALFFNDPSRMERDLLSDAATAELMRRFGKLGALQP